MNCPFRIGGMTIFILEVCDKYIPGFTREAEASGDGFEEFVLMNVIIG